VTFKGYWRHGVARAFTVLKGYWRLFVLVSFFWLRVLDKANTQLSSPR